MKAANYIEWKLDDEYELDGDDPLGEVRISGEEGCIVESCTYLDSFLEALINGISQIDNSNQKISVDPMVEPDNIDLEYIDNVLRISYGSQCAFIHDLKQMKNALTKAVRRLVEKIDDLTDQKSKERRQLLFLRQYLQQSDSS